MIIDKRATGICLSNLEMIGRKSSTNSQIEVDMAYRQFWCSLEVHHQLIWMSTNDTFLVQSQNDQVEVVL